MSAKFTDETRKTIVSIARNASPTSASLMNVIDMYANCRVLFLRSKDESSISADDVKNLGILADELRAVVEERVSQVFDVT